MAVYSNIVGNSILLRRNVREFSTQAFMDSVKSDIKNREEKIEETKVDFETVYCRIKAEEYYDLVNDSCIDEYLIDRGFVDGYPIQHEYDVCTLQHQFFQKRLPRPVKEDVMLGQFKAEKKKEILPSERELLRSIDL